MFYCFSLVELPLSILQAPFEGGQGTGMALRPIRGSWETVDVQDAAVFFNQDTGEKEAYAHAHESRSTHDFTCAGLLGAAAGAPQGEVCTNLHLVAI